MKEQEAKNQLCKMALDIAERIGEYSTCVCGEGEQTDPYEIPNEVIEEMWSRTKDEVR